MADEIFAKLSNIIRDTFDAPDAEIAPDTIAIDIPGWDSLSHTILILTVEERFGVHFVPGQSFENVGELADAIRKAAS